MKFAEIKDKTEQELQVLFKEAQLKLGRLSFELKSKTLKNVSEIGKTRKEIAQLLTALNRQSNGTQSANATK